MKLNHAKNRPTDRSQIDPRVVIGNAQPAAYLLVSGSPDSAETEKPRSWRAIHGDIPL